MPEKRQALLVRLPLTIMKELREAAERDGRSLNGAILVAVRAYIQDVRRRLGEAKAAA